MLQVKPLSRHSEGHLLMAQSNYTSVIFVSCASPEYAAIIPQMGFLRLPTEIRQRIFFHVLGGCLLRRRVDPNDQGQWVCYAPSKSSRSQSIYDQIEGPTLADRLRILLVCRDFYKEAAKIPISENTFYFDQAYQFPRFLRQLRPFQLHALRQYTLQWGLTATKHTNALWPHGFEAHEISNVTFETRDEELTIMNEGAAMREVCYGFRSDYKKWTHM